MSARWSFSARGRARAATGTPLALAALLLTACVAMPSLDRPSPAAPARYTAAELQLESATQSANAQRLVLGEELGRDWWQLFGSDDVDAVVRSALQSNREVAAAAADLQQATALVSAQDRSTGPDANVSAGAGRQKYGKQFFGDSLPAIPPFTYFSLGAELSDSIDFGGASQHRLAQQRALADFARQRLRASMLTVSGSAVSRFIDAATARTQLATLDALLQQDRQYITLLRDARSAGSVSQLDVAQAEARLAADAALLPPVRDQLGGALNALAVLRGQPPAAAEAPHTEVAALVLPQRLPAALPSELAHRRPDILAAESQLQATVAGVGIAHAAFYPRLTLTATTGLQATELGKLFDHSSGVFGLSGSFVEPLLNRGTLRAQQDAAVAAMHASAARYEQTVLQAFGQVADALQALDHDAERLTASEQSRAAEAARVDLLRLARDEGASGILPLLEADRRRQLAELDTVRARAQQLQDTVRLFVALGGSAPEPEPAVK